MKHKTLRPDEISSDTPLMQLTDAQLATVSAEQMQLGSEYMIECSGVVCWLKHKTKHQDTHILGKLATIGSAMLASRQLTQNRHPKHR